VGFGRSLPAGRLAVFSVDTEEEAKKLITLACPKNPKGEYVAPELVRDQTIPNLQLFSNRLAKAHQMLKDAGQCKCSKPGMYPVITEEEPSPICEDCGEEETMCIHECQCGAEFCVNTYGECPGCGL